MKSNRERAMLEATIDVLDLRKFEYWMAEAVERSRDGCFVAAGLYMGHANVCMERLPSDVIRGRALTLFRATLDAIRIIERGGRQQSARLAEGGEL